MIKRIIKERKKRLKNVYIDRDFNNNNSINITLVRKDLKNFEIVISSNKERDDFIRLIIQAFKETTKFNKNYKLKIKDNEIILSYRDISKIMNEIMEFPSFLSEEECIYDRMLNGSIYNVFLDQFSIRFVSFKSSVDNKEIAEEHSFTFENINSMKETFEDLINTCNEEGKYFAETDYIEIESETELDTLTTCKTIGDEIREIVNFELKACKNGDVFIKEKFVNKNDSIMLFEGNIHDIEFILDKINKYIKELF